MTNAADVITVTIQGRTFRCTRRTAAHLRRTIQRLAERHPGAELVIIQTCYNSGVSASAGTHDFDAVFDVLIRGIGWWDAQRFLRECGWAAWYRHTGSWSDASKWHIHMVSLGYPGRVGIFVPGQVDDYYRHTLGLKGQHNTDLDKSWFPGDVGPNPPVGTPAQWRAAINATVFGYVPEADPPKEPTVVKPYRIDGVDISHWQTGDLDFTKARNAGVRWVYHKATEGTSYVDPRYAGRVREIRARSIPAGAYHFARPASSGGLAQARHFLATTKPATGDMRPMLDLEDDGDKSRLALTAWVGDFVSECVRQTGVAPFIYTPFDLTQTFDCPLWTARYSNSNAAPRIPQPWKAYTVHQFSNGVFGLPKSVPGLGNVDLNTMAGDPAELTAKFTLGATPDPKPTPPVQEDDMPLSKTDLDAIRAIVSEEVEKRVGDAVPIPANLAGVWKPTNEKLTVASAVSYLLSKVDPAEQPGK